MKKKLRFYLVDDDPDLVDFIKILIETAGHEIACETSAEAALTVIEETKPDCTLVDLMMPGLDGLELCRRLRANAELDSMKIIVVSAKPYEFDRQRAYEFGADGFITKPLDSEKFLETVKNVIEDRISVAYWGVRGTLPVPGEKSLRYGGNTSCVSMEFSRDRFFVFDAGTGIKALSDQLIAKARRRLDGKIFITHPHWDHINSLPFFMPLFFQGNEFEILGASHGDITMRKLISAQMEGVYFPINLKEFAARIYFRDLGEEVIHIDGIVVRTMLLSHPGNCLGYRIEYNGHVVCYVTDNELFLESSPFYNRTYTNKLIGFVGDADVLITDSTYTDAEYASKVGWGHSCISQVVDLADKAGVKALHLFHHDPDQADIDIDAKLATARALLEERGSATRCEAPKEGDVILI